MKTQILLVTALIFAGCRRSHSKTQNINAHTSLVRFIAVGDIMLDRGTERIAKKEGTFFPFRKIYYIIRRYDLAFCNLESIISKRGRPIRKPITFEADTEFIQPLKMSGFNVINLSNNHALDFGRNALSDCISRLKKAGFHIVGAGNTLKEAYTPLIVKKNSIKIAFISYCLIPTGVPTRENATQIAVFNLDTAISIIHRLRDSVDFIIISLHWGIEYKHHPSKEQKLLAHKLIDAGADIILGHHPHVIQELEFYKNKPIIYSLGNFIFDQKGEERNEAVMFACTLSKKGKINAITLWPIKITGTQPRLLNTYEETKFIRRYKLILGIH